MGTDAAIDIAARISGATTDIATRVTGAIRDAARVTGAGFEYLLNTALRESNLNPNARAKSSSATGLFQFIDQTWLGTMKQSGAALGYGKYADAIAKTSSGRYVVSDPAIRTEIFALRKDATANSLMAGAFANSNAKVLTGRLGRKPTDGELYMAHFLGASGAARFIRAAEANPDGKAASLFPRAAHANSTVFYDKTGAARSLKQVYAGLVSRHNVIGSATQVAAVKAAPVPAAPPLIQAANDVPLAPRAVKTIAITPAAPAITTATAAAVTPSVSSASVAGADNAATFSDRVAAFAPEPPQANAPQEAPMFQTLFSSDQRGAVAPVVRELWGPRHAAAAETSAAVAPPTDISAQRKTGPALNAPLDLFQFMRPNVRRPA
ncbi:MAG: lytic transglycosylase domain-containing protein [Alphaproteobacteria bacterium]|nr:MAG: lytic transglycosylase domain-containing protein [Alphaproteobacteria bacterium]